MSPQGAKRLNAPLLIIKIYYYWFKSIVFIVDNIRIVYNITNAFTVLRRVKFIFKHIVFSACERASNIRGFFLLSFLSSLGARKGLFFLNSLHFS